MDPETSTSADKAIGLKSFQVLKKQSDWHGWSVAMQKLFVLNDVYDEMEGVFPEELDDAKDETTDKPEVLSTTIVYSQRRDPRMKRLIKAASLIETNLGPNVLVVIQGINDPHKAWRALETWCIGSGPVQYTNLLDRLATMKSTGFKSTQEYCTEFDSVRRDLIGHGRRVPEMEYTNSFIRGAANQFPAWADRWRGMLRMRLSTITLDAVMGDLMDEAAQKAPVKTEEFSNFADNHKGKKKGRRPARRYKAGECPHKGHSADDCWADHPEKKPDWAKAKDKNREGQKAAEDDSSSTGSDAPEANLVEYSFMTEEGSSTSAWLADSGSTCHIANNEVEFENLERGGSYPPIRTGGGMVYPEGQGRVRKVVSSGKGWKVLTLHGVYFCPGFSKNILSLQKVYANGAYLQGLKLHTPNGDHIADLSENFFLKTREGTEESHAATTTTKAADIDITLWHSRLGHIGEAAIRRTAKVTKGIEAEAVVHEPLICEPCDLGRSLRYTPRPGRPIPSSAGEEWHLDSVQVGYPDGQGEMWAIIFTVGKFGFRKTATFSEKREGPVAVLAFLRQAARQWKVEVKRLQVDGGSELVGANLGELKAYFETQGIEVVESAPYTPEQNGVAERSNRLIIEKARVWMIACQAPTFLWPWFWQTAVDYTNFTTNNKTTTVGKTPYEAFMDENDPGKPHTVDLTNLRTPGCKVYVNIPTQRRVKSAKFAPTAEEGILVGWKGRTTYQVYVPSRPGHLHQQVIKTGSLVFHENVGSRVVHSEVDHASEEEPIADSITVKPRIVRTLPPNSRRRPQLLETLFLECCHLSEMADIDPTTLTEALSRPNGKEWKESTFGEFRNILANRVFEAVPRASTNQKPLTARLVFKSKLDSEGQVDKLKVRLVARGFEQRQGVDFEETFASVAKANTWRILLALGATYDWDIQQIDVVSAFLNGELEEEVYMEIPEGMALFFNENPEENTIGFDATKKQILRVLRALYGLKQAPRQWQKALKHALDSLGFVQLRSDNAVFVHHHEKLIICTYVDDFLIMGPETSAVRQFKENFGKIFKIKDLGDVAYFLGVRILRDRPSRRITLMQDAFANRILEAKHLENVKPAKTPLAQGSLVHAVPREDVASKAERLAYASTGGSLMYLMTNTRPDYGFALSVTSRYSHNPSAANLTLVQHCLRYLRGTVNYGLILGGKHEFPEPLWEREDFKMDGDHTGSKLSVNVWTDSDWKGDKATGKSTHAYVVQLGTSEGNIVSWRSKRTSRVMLSSTEAEYYALGKGAQQALWMRGLFTELRIPTILTLKGDNQGSIKLSKNPEFHQRTGHIPLEEHFLRDEIEAGRLKIDWVPTEEQLADGLTKILPSNAHTEMVRRLGMEDVLAQGVRFQHPL